MSVDREEYAIREYFCSVTHEACPHEGRCDLCPEAKDVKYEEHSVLVVNKV